jgi:hypothetical protein
MPVPYSSNGFSASNIEILTNLGPAIVATDFGTSGDSGFSGSHAQIAKLTWGTSTNTFRVSEAFPMPMKLYGVTGATLPISGTITGTGDFFVRTNPTIPLIIRGSTFTADAPVAVTGSIQGVVNGVAVGVTGTVNITNQVAMFGISGATAVAVTGGRRLSSSTDSVTVFGNVGLSGGLALSAATNSVSVFGPGGSNFVMTNLYSNGTTLGVSGDALKVAVTNSGFTFSVSVAATTGVTNSGGPLQIQGYSGSSGFPLTIKGSLAGGAVEIAAVSAVPVGISGTVSIDDADIISEIDSLRTDIGTVATNAGYALDILNLINASGNGAKVVVNSINRPSRVVHNQKTVTTSPAILGTDSLRTGVTLKSPNSNSVDIYIGNSISVSNTTGYILSPGESIYLEVSTLGSLFARSASGTATLVYIGT